MNNQHTIINISAAFFAVFIATSTVVMARTTSVTVNNDATNPLPIQETNSHRRFVGVTTETIVSVTGVHDLNDTCNAEFSGSSMCTTTEFVNSSVKPEKSGFAWIRPDIITLPIANNNELVYVDKVSGLNTLSTTFDSLNCHGWNIGRGSSGLIANQEGEFRLTNQCETQRPVMCCSDQ